MYNDSLKFVVATTLHLLHSFVYGVRFETLVENGLP